MQQPMELQPDYLCELKSPQLRLSERKSKKSKRTTDSDIKTREGNFDKRAKIPLGEAKKSDTTKTSQTSQQQRSQEGGICSLLDAILSES